MGDPLAPNQEDEDGPYWDPWTALGISCGGYSSAVDSEAIAVLRAIRHGVEESRYVTGIAAATGLSEGHVELWQYIFCSADWCEYGTSPRGCWIVHDHGDDFGDRLIAAWEAYYERQWKEPFPPHDGGKG